MTTPSPCDRCDMHGPDLPTTETAMLNLHRAIHDFGRTASHSLTPLIRLTQRTAK